MITYRNAGGRDHFIRINWVTLCGLALLDEPLQVGGKNHQNFCASAFKNALNNIIEQLDLSQKESDETANILCFLPLSDLKRIASATIPKGGYINFGLMKGKSI